MHIRRLLLALSIVFIPALANADRDVSFCEYRYLEDLGQVRVTRGSIQLPGLVSLEGLNDPALEKKGIFSLEPDPTRTYRRSVTIDGKAVEVEITAFAPKGSGLGGAVATSDIRVSINGVKVADAPLASLKAQIDDLSIMPADGMISVRGSFDGKPVEGILFLRSKKVVTQQWLSEHVRQ